MWKDKRLKIKRILNESVANLERIWNEFEALLWMQKEES